MDPVAFELSAVGDYNRQRQAKVYREYQAALKKNNALDFDDLIIPFFCKGGEAHV